MVDDHKMQVVVSTGFCGALTNHRTAKLGNSVGRARGWGEGKVGGGGGGGQRGEELHIFADFHHPIGGANPSHMQVRPDNLVGEGSRGCNHLGEHGPGGQEKGMGGGWGCGAHLCRLPPCR